MQVIHQKISKTHSTILLVLFLSILTTAFAIILATPLPTLALSTSSDDSFSVNVDLSLNLTLSSNSLYLPIVPKEGGQFGRTSMTIWADTNNTTGYNLTMQATNDTLTNKVNENTIIDIIKPLSNPVSCTDESDDTCNLFPSNQWGYRINKRDNDNGDNSNVATGPYLPITNITTTPLQLSHTHTYTTNTDPVATIYFGAKVDETKPAGIYEGVALNFIMTSNMTMPNMALVYMQDFASLNEAEKAEVLDAMVEDEQYILTDKRDGKDYYISKLKDGKVWMTQNLDFDITAETVPYLTSQYTNLTTTGGIYGTDTTGGYSQDLDGVITWKPAASAYTIMTGRDKTGTSGEINYGTNTGKWANNDSTPYTVDIGKWYQTGTYFASSICNDVSWSVGCNVLNSGLVNANNNASTPLSNYFKNNSTFETNGEHGAIGNYYNWNAAVASNATSSVTSGTYANSICPAGWGLPANGEYGVLNSTYNAGSTTNDKATTNGLMGAPLYIVRGGFVYTNTTSSLSTTYEIGRNGYYWSSTASGATTGYSLHFRSGYVYPANSHNRGRGFSVRCRAL